MGKRDTRSRYLRAFPSFFRDASFFTRLMPSQLEDNLSKAISSYREGSLSSIRACAAAFSIPLSTLSHRLSGRTSRSTAHTTQQILSTAEEEALVKWISRLSKAGCPITLPLTSSLVEEIRTRRYPLSTTPPSYPPISKRYLDRLRARYPTIATIYSRQIEASRYTGTSYTIVESYPCLQKFFNIRTECPSAIR